MPIWLQIILAVFAACQITETFRHGAILAPVRAWIESRGPFWADLIGCGFCFSHWSSAFVVFILLVGHNLMATGERVWTPGILIIVWLAVIRGSNLLNDVTKRWSRTPTDGELDIPGIEDEDLSDDRIDEDRRENGQGGEETAGSKAN